MNLSKIIAPILFLFSNRIQPAIAQINLKDALKDDTKRIGPAFQIEKIGTLIMRSMEVILLLTGLWLFICIIWSGLEWQFARGAKGDLEKAKTRLTNCTLGLTVVCLAYAIILAVQFFFFGPTGQIFPTT